MFNLQSSIAKRHGMGEAKKRRHITVPPKYFAMGTPAHNKNILLNYSIKWRLATPYLKSA